MQTLSGADALAFVRQRHGLPQGDLSRIRRQQVFLAATADKLLSAGTLTSPSALAALVGVAQQSVVIDSGWDLLAFAQQAADIAKGNIAFVTIPTSGAERGSRGDVVLVDTFGGAGLRRPARQAQDEAARAAGEQAARPKPGPYEIIPSRYVVDIRNGSGTDGLAGQVMAVLRGQGFLRGTVDNADTTAESVVRYTGSRREGRRRAGRSTSAGSPRRRSTTASRQGTCRCCSARTSTAAWRPRPPPRRRRPRRASTGPITAAGVPCVD